MGLFSKIKKIGKKVLRSPITQKIAPSIPIIGGTISRISQRSVAESLISRKRGGVPITRRVAEQAQIARSTLPQLAGRSIGQRLQRSVVGPGGMRGFTPGLTTQLRAPTTRAAGRDFDLMQASKATRPGQGTLDLLGITPPGGTMALFPAVARGAGTALARTFGGRGLVRTATGRASGVLLPSGQRVSRRNAVSVIKRIGFEAAGAALAITAFEAAELLLAENQAATRRRRRGVSGADIRCATRTMRRVKSLACQLGVKAAAPRRRSCPK